MLRHRPYVPTTFHPVFTNDALTSHLDIHEGIPLGAFAILHDTRTYISNPKPAASGAKQNVVLLIPDIFGVDLINAKLVADDWAQNGWKVVLPDFTENGPVDVKYLKVRNTAFR